MSTSKKILALGLLLGAPGLTFAAFNDATTLTTATILSVNGTMFWCYYRRCKIELRNIQLK